MWIRVPGSLNGIQRLAAFPSSQLQAWLTATRPRTLAKAGGSGQRVRSLRGHGVTILLGLRRQMVHPYPEEGRGVCAKPTEAATADCRETVSDAINRCPTQGQRFPLPWSRSRRLLPRSTDAPPSLGSRHGSRPPSPAGAHRSPGQPSELHRPHARPV